MSAASVPKRKTQFVPRFIYRYALTAAIPASGGCGQYCGITLAVTCYEDPSSPRCSSDAAVTRADGGDAGASRDASRHD